MANNSTEFTLDEFGDLLNSLTKIFYFQEPLPSFSGDSFSLYDILQELNPIRVSESVLEAYFLAYPESLRSIYLTFYLCKFLNSNANFKVQLPNYPLSLFHKDSLDTVKFWPFTHKSNYVLISFGFQ